MNFDFTAGKSVSWAPDELLWEAVLIEAGLVGGREICMWKLRDAKRLSKDRGSMLIKNQHLDR